MKSSSDIISALNASLKGQLTLINQSFLHARIARNWGLEEINEYEYKVSIRAMKDADKLIERILLLEGLPGMQALDRIRIGEGVEEMFKGDMKVLEPIINQLREAVSLCESHKDFVSRAMLVEILETAEDIVDWIETQQWQIENAGLANYTAAQMETE